MEIINKIRESFYSKLNADQTEIKLIFEQAMVDALAQDSRSPKVLDVSASSCIISQEQMDGPDCELDSYMVTHDIVHNYRSAALHSGLTPHDWEHDEAYPNKLFKVVYAEDERDASRVAGPIPD